MITKYTLNDDSGVFNRNLVVYFLAISCDMILLIGLFACKKIWTKGDTRKVQTINKDRNFSQRDIRVISSNGIYDAIEELEMEEHFDIKPVLMKNTANANKATCHSDDTNDRCPLNLENENSTTGDNNYLCPVYSEDSNSNSDAVIFAVHASGRSILTFDQTNYLFENDEDTRDSKGYEKIYDVTHEPCRDSDNPSEILEQDNRKIHDETHTPYQLLQENWKQDLHTHEDTFNRHPWTLRSISSSGKNYENNDLESYINGNMQYSHVDNRLHENQDNTTHSYLQLLSVADTSTNKEETIC